MSHPVHIGKRDLAILGLLDLTPATAIHIRKASITFPEAPFLDDRRVRERLHALGQAGLVASFPAAPTGGGTMYYYRLTPEGFRTLRPDADEAPPRSVFSEIGPSMFRHAMTTADIIVHTIASAHSSHVRILKSHGDGRLRLEIGRHRQEPDCHFQFAHGERVFNVLFEIDNATEPLDSPREQSIRTKLLGYEAYQDWVMDLWHRNGRIGARPLFRVVFLTLGTERANHMLWLARECAPNPGRRLCYAGTQDAYLGEACAVTAPILLDHHGHWQSLVNVQPTSAALRSPVRIVPPLPRYGVV